MPFFLLVVRSWFKLRCVSLIQAHVLNTYIDVIAPTKKFLQLSKAQVFDFFPSKRFTFWAVSKAHPRIILVKMTFSRVCFNKNGFLQYEMFWLPSKDFYDHKHPKRYALHVRATHRNLRNRIQRGLLRFPKKLFFEWDCNKTLVKVKDFEKNICFQKNRSQRWLTDFKAFKCFLFHKD